MLVNKPCQASVIHQTVEERNKGSSMASAIDLQENTGGAHTLLSPSGDQLLHHGGLKFDALADEQLHIAHSCGRPVDDPDNSLTCQ